jgi:outer membrane receptor for ferrienterochelin and colicin
LPDNLGKNNSQLQIGYSGRFLTDNFEASDYDSNPVSGYFDVGNLKMDEHYNQENLKSGAFWVEYGYNKYDVTKYIHSLYAEAAYQLSSTFTANMGVKADKTIIYVNYDVNKGGDRGGTTLKPLYILPSMNLKYNLNEKNIIRFGASKTYTLPQSKEISPYIYIGLNFKSQGNRNLKPSENYNIDLKWDYYPSAPELISINPFYKHIVNPIVRDERGGSANLLTYNNISDYATVAGIELETRKNIFAQVNTQSGKVNRLTAGLNASYIYSRIKFTKTDNSQSESQLEGAAPFIANFDLSHTYSVRNKSFTNSLVLNYFSNRVHTIGVRPLFNNIVEEGAPALDFVSSAKITKNISLKLKGSNLLNPSYRLTREGSSSSAGKLVLSEYKKGMNISLGISCEL